MHHPARIQPDIRARNQNIQRQCLLLGLLLIMRLSDNPMVIFYTPDGVNIMAREKQLNSMAKI